MESSFEAYLPVLCIAAAFLAVIFHGWCMGRAPAGKGWIAFGLAILCALFSGLRLTWWLTGGSMAIATLALVIGITGLIVFRIAWAANDKEGRAFFLGIIFLAFLNNAGHVIFMAIGV